MIPGRDRCQDNAPGMVSEGKAFEVRVVTAGFDYAVRFSDPFRGYHAAFMELARKGVNKHLRTPHV